MGKYPAIVSNTPDAMQRVNMVTFENRAPVTTSSKSGLLCSSLVLLTMEETVVFPLCFESLRCTTHLQHGCRWISILMAARIKLIFFFFKEKRKVRFYEHLCKMYSRVEDWYESPFDLTQYTLSFAGINASKCVSWCINVSGGEEFISK